jgi:hypothetical protein
MPQQPRTPVPERHPREYPGGTQPVLQNCLPPASAVEYPRVPTSTREYPVHITHGDPLSCTSGSPIPNSSRGPPGARTGVVNNFALGTRRGAEAAVRSPKYRTVRDPTHQSARRGAIDRPVLPDPSTVRYAARECPREYPVSTL